jgi:hypothetical protein
VCELGLEERPLGTGEGSMLDESVEQVLVFGAAQPVQQERVPARQRAGSGVTVTSCRSRPVTRRAWGAVGGLVEDLEVADSEGSPVVGDRQHPLEHLGQWGFLLRDAAPAVAGPPVPGLPSGQLWSRPVDERVEPMPVADGAPQRGDRVRDHEPGSLHRIVRPEVVQTSVSQARSIRSSNDVHDLGRTLLPAADLSGVDAQMRAQSFPPLGKQRLAVNEHERRCGVARDQGACHNGLARPGGRFEHPELVSGHHLDGLLLCTPERTVELQVDGRGHRPFIDDQESTARLLHDGGGLLHQSARQVEVLEVLGVAADEPGCGVVGQPEVLVLVERRVVQRPEVLECGVEPWRDAGPSDGEHACQPRVDGLGWRLICSDR